MIEDISIRDLGVISEAKLNFHPGLTVLTGETGAGKTMVLTALGLLLGARADSGMIRAGSAQAVLEGRWKLALDNPAIAKAEDAGALVEDGELLVLRSVGNDSRSKAAIGGRSAPVGLLTELGEHLVVVHGQSDQIRLKSPVAQRVALDRFAGSEHQELLATYLESFNSWRGAKAQLDEILKVDSTRAAQIEELKEALTLLEKLAISPNEDVELSDLAKRLTHTEELRVAVGLAHDALQTDSFDGVDALGLVGKARKSVENASSNDSSLEPLASKLNDIVESLNEASVELASYLSALEAENGMSIDEIQARRSEITSALRRFGPTIEDLIEYEKTAQQKLLDLDTSTERIEELYERVNQLEAIARAQAEQLSQNRSKAAKELALRVTSELVALAMSGSKFHVEIEKTESLTQSGLDNVSFLLESYAGAEPRPLGKGASGGELSRIMLAIEVILAESDSAPTFIFDEVDAGVGGAAAIEVGRRLAQLAKKAQVIVVTHLAQVAAFADQHLAIIKTSDAMFTASDVRVLDESARAEELARMLSGLSDSETARSHALELVELAKNS
jgi:DNA repair protein RecN (Recombination protein N)